jgi:hypothetical protein
MCDAMIALHEALGRGASNSRRRLTVRALGRQDACVMREPTAGGSPPARIARLLGELISVGLSVLACLSWRFSHLWEGRLMKCSLSALARCAALSALVWASAASPGHAVLLNSWENSVEGWGILQAPYSTAGFSTTTGVTDQAYSWQIVGTDNPDYSAMLGGPSTLALTAILATTDKILVDVTIPTGGDFGWFQQWQAVVNNTDTGYLALGPPIGTYAYNQSPTIGDSIPDTLSWSLSPAVRATLAASTNPTSIVFQVGGGDPGGTFYVDNLRTTPIPEPAAGVMLAAGAAALAVVRRRQR